MAPIGILGVEPGGTHFFCTCFYLLWYYLGVLFNQAVDENLQIIHFPSRIASYQLGENTTSTRNQSSCPLLRTLPRLGYGAKLCALPMRQRARVFDIIYLLSLHTMYYLCITTTLCS